ncbi:hypothetical protein H7S74_30205 [Priestia aryabhattai]|uniref:hypothetical protein n=1 Tax=Priestia aryabhattai TaxID=412384 RepID=UPI001EBE76FD|nr:hypothetical protein [Priestia aryabhattai]MBY0094944.1 hypothetical protein [Priestia aryabhattai]MBY0105568.1 hypothetical protein [Priestia aryabhattai]
MSVKKLIINALEPIAPTEFHEYEGDATTYITFFEYNQRAGTFADDEEKTTIYSYQIDVYSPNNIEDLAKQVKDALKEVGFYRTSEMELYNKTTQLYRKVISVQGSFRTEE